MREAIKDLGDIKKNGSQEKIWRVSKKNMLERGKKKALKSYLGMTELAQWGDS